MEKVRTHATATNGEENVYVIEWTNGGRAEYTTHAALVENPDALYTGHYYTTLEAARADFDKRAAWLHR